MATKSRRSGQDRKRLSRQSQKVAKKAGASRKAGTRTVRKAKKQTRKVSR